jgi:hypothetical protein
MRRRECFQHERVARGSDIGNDALICPADTAGSRKTVWRAALGSSLAIRSDLIEVGPRLVVDHDSHLPKSRRRSLVSFSDRNVRFESPSVVA